MFISKHIISGVRTAERMRQRIAKAGHVNGHPLWTDEEKATVRRCYPDYAAARRLLRRRTYWAIRKRAERLGIQRKRHIWTGADVVRLRRVYPRGTEAELRAAFPGLTLRAIKGSARHKGIRRARRRLKNTGHPLLDAIRERCFGLGYSMVDLDDIARTRKYFQAAGWYGKRPSLSRLCKAVVALGGTLSVTWQD